MRIMRFVVAAGLTFWIGYGVHAQQGTAQPPAGARGQGGGTPGQLIGGTGTVAMVPVDARGCERRGDVCPADYTAHQPC